MTLRPAEKTQFEAPAFGPARSYTPATSPSMAGISPLGCLEGE